MATDMVKSTCELCNLGCGVLITMIDGKPVKVDGDPDNPINRGAICIKGMASLEYLYHPDRLKYPLKRTGLRGEGKWQQISWDEALNTIAGNLISIKEKYGGQAIAFIRGRAKGYGDAYPERLANVFGVPNKTQMAPNCYMPRRMASQITYGFMALPDYEYPPACIVMWAVNTRETAIGEYLRAADALKKGSKLVVIDPAETGFAQKANIWVKPRPCSDLALALGMINVIINEGLYDKEFVDKWTVGFEQLKAHVQTYSPDKVQEITWVQVETIRQAARFYATNKPACIVWGNGLDNNINNFQGDRAICILRAITGNLGRPGGDIDWSPPVNVYKYSPDMVKQDVLGAEMHAKRLSAGEGLLPVLAYAIPQNVIKGMREGVPNQVRAAIVQGLNMLHTWAGSLEVYQALNKVDFLVVTDFFMTPTAELADIVLPVGTYLEVDGIHESEYTPTASVIQKVAQIGECWSDCRINSELAKRLGVGKYFWDEDKQILDYYLKPAGLTFDEFRKVGFIGGTKQYRKHEKSGFGTPSKKVEIYSSQLKEWGHDPLPVFHEPPESPLSEPKLAKEYPLVFTNFKRAAYLHAAGRQIATLRGNHPEPLVIINTDTANRLKIREGDWVIIENMHGKIRQKAVLNPNIDPRVVLPDLGWSFPEKKTEMQGWAESNINVLTSLSLPPAREMGSATLRGLVCKVYKE